MPRLAAALLLLGLSACALLPPRGELAMRDVSFPVTDLRYASGLRVLVEEDRRAPVVAVVTLVGSGGASDPQGQEGLAHLVEHLTYRAHAPERPSRWGQLEAAGAGHLNAVTSFDTTVYQSLAPRESLGEVLRIEGERLARPLEGLTPRLLDVEREVVRNELREGNETGFVGQVFSALQRASFPEGHPYARPVVGAHASLSALTLAEAGDFAQRHYRPENTTLVIVGDVDPASVEGLLARHLPASLLGAGRVERLPDARLPEASPPVPLPPRTDVADLEAAVLTPEVYLGWTLPRAYDAAGFPQDFVERGLVSVLSRAMGEDGDIAGVSTSLIPGREASLLVARVVLRTGEHPERSTQHVLDQLYHLWEKQTSAEAVLAAEAALRAQRLATLTGRMLEAEDLLARARSRAALTHFSLDAQASTRALAAVARVEASHVTRFAYDYLSRERARVVRVRPSTGAAGEGGATGRVTPLSLEEDVAGQVPLTPTPSLSGFRTLHLDNGLEVVLGARPGLPLASVRVWLHGGTQTGEPLGVGTLTNTIVQSGSHFQGTAADYGLSQVFYAYPDHATFGFTGAAGNLPNMLAMTAEQLSSLKTEEAHVFFFREHYLPYLEKAEARPEAVSARVFRGALYPQHPYGRVPLAADLQKVGEGEIEAWVERTYRPANAVVAIVGELDLDETEKQVRAWLSTWRGPRGEPTRTPPPPPAPAHPVQFLMTPNPGATQTWVAWGCPLPPADAAIEARYDVMAELASKRLYHQVRTALGASYGLHGHGPVHEGGAAHLEVQGAVENAQLVPALAAVRQMLRELSEGKWRPAELEAARQRVNQERALSLGTTAALADAVLGARGRGWPLAEVEDYARHLTAIPPEALQRDFAWCAEHLVVSLRGEEAVMRAAVASWPPEAPASGP